MLSAARLLESFVHGYNKATFLADAKTQSAVLHQLLLLGEAAKRLTNEFRAQQTGLPWRSITGMRDMLIHEYDEVDLDEVWKTATSDVPELIRILSPFGAEWPPAGA